MTSGGALPLADFQLAGFTPNDLAADVRTGRLIRLRRGWYGSPDAPGDVLRAVRVGGALTATSAARLHHLWLLDDDELHVRVPSTAARLRSPDDATKKLDLVKHRVCVHYRSVDPSRTHRYGPARDSLISSIAEMFRCSGTIPAMVALESALNRRVLPQQALESIRSIVPVWAKRQLDLADPESDSGLETIARLLFERMGVHVRSQVRIEGVRAVDLLVGDRLIIELDGREFHSGEEFTRDRVQDLELSLRGYLVVRLSHRMVTQDWDRIHRAVRQLVIRGLHRWGRSAREHAPFDPYTGIEDPTSL
jgi:very-short-patch-repair endonuclease